MREGYRDHPRHFLNISPGSAKIRLDSGDRLGYSTADHNMTIYNVPGYTTVEKPWGYELIWAKTAHYVGKILHINAGEALSLQYHRVKDETIMVLVGRLTFEFFVEGENPRSIELCVGERFHVAPGVRHRMTAIEATDVLEVSTPELEDVVRLEDRYGRTA